MRIKYKKRFYTIVSIFFIVVLLILYQLIHNVMDSYVSTNKTSEVINNKVLVSSASGGSIQVEENDYYKKYTITTKNPNSTLSYYEKEGYFFINLKKGDIEKPNTKLESGKNSDDIFLDNKTSNTYSILVIKKLFDSNNGIHIDKYNNKNIVVLISKSKTPYKYKVMLDPGHGGRDPGIQYKSPKLNINEKDIALNIALYMVDRLTYQGCQVKLTRDKDIELDKNLKLDLKKRSDMANVYKPDAFVSIHINGFDSSKDTNYSTYNGITTFYYPNKDTKQNEKRKNLADILQKNILQKDDWNDRKVQQYKYSVLNHTNMPSALIECGFLSNPKDRNKLDMPSIQYNLAQSIEVGLMEYFNLDSK